MFWYIHLFKNFPITIQHSFGSFGHSNQNTSIPVAQMVNDLPAMQETQIQSLAWEYLLEKNRQAVYWHPAYLTYMQSTS